MAITVLKEGKSFSGIKYMLCPSCECLFTFEKEDIEGNDSGSEKFECVKCPNCNKRLDLKLATDTNLNNKSYNVNNETING